MVNNTDPRILVAGACKIKKTVGGREQILNGPVYDLSIAKALLKQYGLCVVNDDADADLQNDFSPTMLEDELCKFILALTDDDHEGSERCKTSIKMTIDADSYAMKWNRNKCIRWDHGVKIYVKFGFSAYSAKKCLIASIHRAKH